jgi:hypothetical protein
LVSHYLANVWIFGQHPGPVLLPDEVPVAGTQSFVHENRPFVERARVGANYSLVLELQHILFHSVYFVSNGIGAPIEEENFILLIQLIDDHSVFVLESWLQGPKDAHHKVYILVVIPCVKLVTANLRIFPESESFFETFEKI